METMFTLIGLFVVVGGLGLVFLSLIQPPDIFEPLVRNNPTAMTVLNIVSGLLLLVGILGSLVTLGATLWHALRN